MPRGFLIKRKKHLQNAWRKLVASEDEQSEVGSTVSEPDTVADNNEPSEQSGSPDSGFSSQNSEPLSDIILDQSIYRKHCATDWIKNDVQNYYPGRPHSVDSVCADAKDNLESGAEDANGNHIKNPVSEVNRNTMGELKHIEYPKKINEFNNNMNNNEDHVGVFNRNLAAFSRYSALYEQKIRNSMSLPNSPINGHLSVNTALYGSPIYWSAFHRLALSSPSTDSCPILSPASTSSSLSAKSPSSSLDHIKVPDFHSKISSPAKRKAHNLSVNDGKAQKGIKRPKSARKISFEEEFKSSPVSGTYIKDDCEDDDTGIRVVSGDIDSSMNIVEITPEAEAELAKIENKIGDFVCKLCKEYHENAFALAQHRCSRIVHVEYRCPECDKVFNCPANLASHRRWHKPKGSAGKNDNSKKLPVESSRNHVKNDNQLLPVTDEGMFACEQCGKKFKRQAYLKKHMLSHLSEVNSVTLTPCHCHICGLLCKNDIERQQHIIQSHDSTDEKNRQDSKLSWSVFNDQVLIEEHKRSHELPSLFTCKFCSEQYSTIYGLGRHMYKCHPTESSQAMLLNLPMMQRTC